MVLHTLRSQVPRQSFHVAGVIISLKLSLFALIGVLMVMLYLVKDPVRSGLEAVAADLCPLSDRAAPGHSDPSVGLSEHDRRAAAARSLVRS